MSRSTRRGCLLGALALLAGCAALGPGPRQLTLSEDRLQALLAARFPDSRRLLGMMELRLENPRLRLLPQHNRLSTQLDYVVTVALPGARPQRGSLSLSYGLRYKADDHTLRLDQLRLDALAQGGAPPPHEGELRRLAELVLNQLLRDQEIHRFKPEEIASAERLGYRPGAITVLPGSVRLEME
jgi:hypothetical protein